MRNLAKRNCLPSDFIAQMQEEARAALPWWQKLRWKQTSRAEALQAERDLLALSRWVAGHRARV